MFRHGGFLRIIILCVIVYEIAATYNSNPFFNGESTNADRNKNNVNAKLSDNPFFQDLYRNNRYFESSFESRVSLDANMRRNPFLKNMFTTTTSITTTTTATTTTKPSVNTKRDDKTVSITAAYPIDERKAITQEALNEMCGRSAVHHLALGGQAVRRGEHPWLAALWHMDRKKSLHFKCGGSIISDKHVVTAAHCVFDMKDFPEQLVFYIGYTNISWNTYTIDATEGVVQGAKVYVHPKYKGFGSIDDIAIVRLMESVIFSPYVRPLCLWPKKYKTEFNSIINYTGQVAGWGINHNGQTTLDTATVVRMPTVSKETCIWSNEAYYNLVTDETFCAGKKDGKGPCKGDSGSSFNLQIDGKWVLRGIVSSSLPSKENQDMCDLYQYVVFVDAAMYLDWMADVMKIDLSR